MFSQNLTVGEYVILHILEGLKHKKKTSRILSIVSYRAREGRVKKSPGHWLDYLAAHAWVREDYADALDALVTRGLIKAENKRTKNEYKTYYSITPEGVKLREENYQTMYTSAVALIVTEPVALI